MMPKLSAYEKIKKDWRRDFRNRMRTLKKLRNEAEESRNRVKELENRNRELSESLAKVSFSIAKLKLFAC